VFQFPFVRKLWKTQLSEVPLRLGTIGAGWAVLNF
jgi:hypothetical protein